MHGEIEYMEVVDLPTHLPTYLPTCLPAYLPTYLPAYARSGMRRSALLA